MGGDFITFYSSARNLHVETNCPLSRITIVVSYSGTLGLVAKFSPCLGIWSKVVILIIYCIMTFVVNVTAQFIRSTNSNMEELFMGVSSHAHCYSYIF